MPRLPSLLWLCLAWPVALPPEEWPSWRVPRGHGASPETGTPLEWSKTKNVLWKAEAPGLGYSSPVVHGDRVFLTTCVETGRRQGDRILCCLDRRTGREVWRKVVL